VNTTAASSTDKLAINLEEIARQQTVRRNLLLTTPALVVLFLAASGPLLVMVLFSFLTAGDYGGVKWQVSTLAWFEVFFYTDIFDETVTLADAHLSILWRSVKLSSLTTLLCFVLGFPTAYFIATRPAETRNFWLFLVTIPFWTNLLIRTFAIMEIIRNAGVINTFLLFLGIIDSPLDMLYTDTAILLGMTYVYIPLMILPIYASLERFDFRLVEAGYDLYATRLKVLWRIIVPLIKPGVIAGSILVFIPSLGAYVTPRILGGGKNLMLGNLIELQFGQGRNWPLGAALSLTLLAIVMIALMFYVRSVQRNSLAKG
jgi:spermidine/putrescine transport system permease protein